MKMPTPTIVEIYSPGSPLFFDQSKGESTCHFIKVEADETSLV